MKKTQEFVNFTFDEFRLLNVSFSVNVDFDFENDVKINPHISRKSEYDEKKRILISYVKVSLTGDEAPFAFTVEGAGHFTFEKKPVKKQLDAVSKINAPAIIYPYIRETIADMTRRAGLPPLHLPPVNFVNLAETE